MSQKINKRRHSQQAKGDALNLPKNFNQVDIAEVDAFNEKQSTFFKHPDGSLNLWTIGIIALLSFGVFGSGLKYLEESAKQEKAANIGRSNFEKSEPSLLSKINPFFEPPPPSPTPQLSKEYIYAGSRMLAVEDKNASAAPPADLAVWRPSTGYWYVMGGQGSTQTSYQWGGTTGTTPDVPVPGDYDGDGKTDFAVWRPAANSGDTCYWYLVYSAGGSYQLGFGLNSDKPAPADFDGDGKTDIAVFRPSTGYWYIQGSSNGFMQIYFGTTGDVPAPADYDGDGRADAALWRASAYTYYAERSSDGQTQTQTIYSSSTLPVGADYDGDGKADFALKQGNDWLIRYSATSYPNATDCTIVPWQSGTKAVQNDYDGDGKVDIAVWNASDGAWKIKQSSNSQTRTEYWGGTINNVPDIPVPAFYRR